MEPKQDKKPKLAVEQVFDRFREFADEVFKDIAEPASMSLVVDWRVGNNDFPVGVLLTREKDAELNILLSMTSQLSKMAMRLLTLLSEQVVKAENNLKNQIYDLEQRKRKLLQESSGRTADISESTG